MLTQKLILSLVLYATLVKVIFSSGQYYFFKLSLAAVIIDREVTANFDPMADDRIKTSND